MAAHASHPRGTERASKKAPASVTVTGATDLSALEQRVASLETEVTELKGMSRGA